MQVVMQVIFFSKQCVFSHCVELQNKTIAEAECVSSSVACSVTSFKHQTTVVWYSLVLKIKKDCQTVMSSEHLKKKILTDMEFSITFFSLFFFFSKRDLYLHLI